MTSLMKSLIQKDNEITIDKLLLPNVIPLARRRSV